MIIFGYCKLERTSEVLSMNHQGIERVLTELNNGQLSDRVFRLTITDTVELARVWLKEPEGEEVADLNKSCFLIKNDEGLYIGAVVEEADELQGIVAAECDHESVGAAMLEVILPMVAHCGHQLQKVTFQDSRLASYFFKRWGGKLTGESTEHAIPELLGSAVSGEEFEVIMKRLRVALAQVMMVKDQLEMAYGPDVDETVLESMVDQLALLGPKLKEWRENHSLEEEKAE